MDTTWGLTGEGLTDALHKWLPPTFCNQARLVSNFIVLPSHNEVALKDLSEEILLGKVPLQASNKTVRLYPKESWSFTGDKNEAIFLMAENCYLKQLVLANGAYPEPFKRIKRIDYIIDDQRNFDFESQRELFRQLEKPNHEDFLFRGFLDTSDSYVGPVNNGIFFRHFLPKDYMDGQLHLNKVLLGKETQMRGDAKRTPFGWGEFDSSKEVGWKNMDFNNSYIVRSHRQVMPFCTIHLEDDPFEEARLVRCSTPTFRLEGYTTTQPFNPSKLILCATSPGPQSLASIGNNSLDIRSLTPPASTSSSFFGSQWSQLANTSTLDHPSQASTVILPNSEDEFGTFSFDLSSFNNTPSEFGDSF